jgi:hypothetical protein
MPWASQQVENLLPEVVRLERFGDEGVGTTLVGPTAGFLLCVSGENQHGEVFGAAIRAKTIEDFPSVHLWKTDVENEQVGLAVDGRFQTLRSIFPHDHLERCRSKTYFDESTDHRRVFNDQHSLCHNFLLIQFGLSFAPSAKPGGGIGILLTHL